ncbi:flagellin [Pseudobacillus sp. 179-B 2D1 NHS]|uniref:flagellin N-terminal helical domain-containing protein n=1 Tax=Pseudobacillus sp. 179-B 2D1 NHS TaxID=3374292 RepID=UPI0038797F3F
MRINDFTVSSLQNTNLAQAQLKAISKSIQNLSSGKKVNSASDDPGKMFRISRTEAAVRENAIEQNNLQDGISLLQTGEQALSHAHDVAQKLRELAVQYQSDTLSIDDRKLIEKEALALTGTISGTLNNATFNTNKIFGGDFSNPRDPMLQIPEFQTISVVSKKEQVDILSRTYDAEISMPNSSEKLKGSFTLDHQQGKKEHEFIVYSNGVENRGKIKFSDDGKTASYQLNFFGNRVNGTLKLNEKSNDKDLTGVQRYQIVGGGEANVSFILRSEEKRIESVAGESFDITLLNLQEESLDKLLNIDYLDKHVLDQLSSMRADLGIKQKTLENRLSYSSTKETQLTSDFSRLVDTDMAKETMSLIKNQVQSQITLSIFKEMGNNHRNYMAGLLQSF